MVRILEIQELKDRIIVRGSLDGEDKRGNGYWMPESSLVPERTWGSVLQTALFEYQISKITSL